MGIAGGPYVIRDSSLVLELDAADLNSYVSGSATWVDLSGNNNSGSLTNGPTFSSANGGSIVFNGTNNFVTVGGTFTGFGSSNRTINTWFIVTSLPALNQAGRVITFPADNTNTDIPAYSLNINSSGLIQNGIGGTPFDGYNLNIISYTLSTWINVTATISGNNITTYVNGVSVGSKTNTGAIAANPICYLGRYNNYYGQYLAGNIANTQVYNRALSATEVKQNYNALKGRFGLT